VFGGFGVAGVFLLWWMGKNVFFLSGLLVRPPPVLPPSTLTPPAPPPPPARNPPPPPTRIRPPTPQLKNFRMEKIPVSILNRTGILQKKRRKQALTARGDLKGGGRASEQEFGVLRGYAIEERRTLRVTHLGLGRRYFSGWLKRKKTTVRWKHQT